MLKGSNSLLDSIERDKTVLFIGAFIATLESPRSYDWHGKRVK